MSSYAYIHVSMNLTIYVYAYVYSNKYSPSNPFLSHEWWTTIACTVVSGIIGTTFYQSSSVP